MAEYQQAAICGIFIQLLGNTSSDTHKYRQKCFTAVSKAYDKLEITGKSEISLWHKNTQKPIIDYVTEASRLNACLPPLLLFYRGEPFTISELNCNTDTEKDTDKLLELEMDVRRAFNRGMIETQSVD
jgi:hypothetical protein